MKKKITAILLVLALAIPVLTLSVFADALKKGDVNGDGKVGPDDARLVLRCAAKLEDFSDEQLKAADVAEPFGRVTSSDARIILRVAAKLEELPVEEDPSVPEPVEYPSIIDSFFKGRFCLAGVMIDSDGTEMPVILASNGIDFEIAASVEGFGFSMLTIKNKTNYMKFADSEGKKKYVEISPEMFKNDGIDFTDIVGDLHFSLSETISAPTASEAELNGKTYTVYTFMKSNGNAVEFYADGDNIVSIRVKNTEGVVITDIIAAEGDEAVLTNIIPDDMLTISGFEKTSILSLLPIIKDNLK